MIYITYISIAVLLYKRLREIYKLQINSRKSIFLYWKESHTIQHQILLVMIIVIMWIMFFNCTNPYWTPILIYNLFAIFFLIPHLRDERKEQVECIPEDNTITYIVILLSLLSIIVGYISYTQYEIKNRVAIIAEQLKIDIKTITKE